MDRHKDGRKDGRMDGWAHGLTDGQMKRWIDGKSLPTLILDNKDSLQVEQDKGTTDHLILLGVC